MVKENQNKINVVLNSLLENLSTMVDANAVVGSPIKTEEGCLIIPVSKITIGILSGGGEYGKLNIFKSGNDLPCSVGNGTIMSLKPCAFLIKDNKEGVKIIQTEKENIEKLFDKAIDLFENVKDNIINE